MAFTAVVDSGVGGLTVLKSLRNKNSQCDFLYLADHAFCPYGTKSVESVKNRVLSVCKFLKTQGAGQIVLACNTASVFAAYVRRVVHIPVFDVIVPACISTKNVTQNAQAALLCTSVTKKCGTYTKILNTMGVEVVSLACDEFVEVVEKQSRNARQVVESKLNKLSNAKFDTVILGCTHFPFLQKFVVEHFPQCHLVSCSESISEYFRAPMGHGNVLYCTTGNKKTATKLLSQFGYEFRCVKI